MPLDPKIAAMFAGVPAGPPLALLTGKDAAITAATLRKNNPVQGPLNYPGVDVRDLIVEVKGAPLSLRIYRPLDVAVRGAVINFHGGGWAIGNLALDDTRLARIAAEADVAVIAVDYRLAPEYPFPAPVEDGMAALAWAAEGGGDLRLDPSRLIVAGSSAGGNIAAAVALLARETGFAPLRMQLLNYPVLDGSLSTPSYSQFSDGPGVTRALMAWFWDAYAGESDRTDPSLAPLHAKDLSGCAPAVIVTAECDVLRDEAESYASRLKACGVPTLLKRFEGVPHGFLSLPLDIAQSREAIDLSIAQIRKFLPMTNE